MRKYYFLLAFLLASSLRFGLSANAVEYVREKTFDNMKPVTALSTDLIGIFDNK